LRRRNEGLRAEKPEVLAGRLLLRISWVGVVGRWVVVRRKLGGRSS
jgi:hypothetical protein